MSIVSKYHENEPSDEQSILAQQQTSGAAASLISKTPAAQQVTPQFTQSDLALIQPSFRKMDSIYAISGFFYVAKFLEWVGAFDSRAGGAPVSLAAPLSLAQLQQAADSLCAMDLVQVREKYEKAPKEEVAHTQPDQVAERCFEANYALVLLSRVFAFFFLSGRFVVSSLETHSRRAIKTGRVYWESTVQ